MGSFIIVCDTERSVCQVLLMDKRFESCLEIEKEEHWLPTQMLRAVVVMPTLSDDQQVDIMKVSVSHVISDGNSLILL